jgi:hypothetical protein
VKIVLVFSDKVAFESDTIYLVTRKLSDIPESAQRVVVPFDADSIELRDEADKFRDFYADALGTGIISDAFVANFHNFYFHIFRNIYKWVIHLEALLDIYPNVQVVITDTVDGFYMPLYEAEGEINKLLFYKNYDFIPELITQFLKQKGINYTILKRHSRFKRASRIFLRRYFVLITKPFFYSIQLLFQKRESEKLQTQAKTLLLSRSIVHTHLLYPLTKVSTDFVTLFSEGFFTRGINSRFFKDRPAANYSLISFYSMYRIWKRFFQVVLSLTTDIRRSKKSAKLAGIELPMRSILIEMLISYYDGLLYGDAILDFMNKKGPYEKIITAETFTQYPYVIKKVLNESGTVKLLQLANGVLNILPNVKFVFADRLAITSDSVLRDYQILHPNEKDRMVYWGDTKEIAGSVLKKNAFRKLIYFSQPYEYQSQERILNFLHKYANINNIEVGVKLHPRDQQTRNLANQFKFKIIETTCLFSEYIQDYDLAISRTSSILKDIILSGVPFIIALFSDIEKSAYNEFIKREYFLKYKDIYAFEEFELENLLMSPDRLCNACNHFLQHYKINNVNEADVIFFADSLSSFSAQ